jgi:hypothetical protein
MVAPNIAAAALTISATYFKSKERKDLVQLDNNDNK